MKKNAFRIITLGGLGDLILSTPVIAALRKKFPESKIIVYGTSKSYQEIFYHNPHIDRVTGTSFLSDPVAYTRFYLKWGRFYSFHYGRVFPTLFYNSPAQDIIAEVFDLQLKDRKIQLFLNSQEEQEASAIMRAHHHPVIIHTTALTTKNKNWTTAKWNELIRSMPNHTFVQIGLKSEPALEGVVDLRGKVTFRQAMGLIKYAQSFVGVDSAFSHVTNAFDIPGVILFGPSVPGIWGHPNNINIYKDLHCSPCIDLLRDGCPYGNACMRDITVEEVREALYTQLRKEKTTQLSTI